MIVTHMGKLGDFIYALPVASWFYKTRGEKITFVLPRTFEPFMRIESLLMSLEMTEKVVLIDRTADNYMMGGQPYVFNPSNYGVIGKYVNLGLKAYPQRFMTEEIARQNNLGWDKSFTINIPKPLQKSDAIVTDQLPMVVTKIEKSSVAVLNPEIDLLDNLELAASFLEVHCSYSGFAVACYFARIPFILYRESNRPSNYVYFPDQTRYRQVDCWIK